MGYYVDYYCDNNSKRLRPIVDTIIKKNFGWLPQKEYDDMYSIADSAVWYCEENYNESKGKSFEKYLIDSLYRKIKTRITHINRKKRNCGIPEISIYQVLDEESGLTVGDIIEAKKDDDIHPLVQKYIDSLTKKQRQVAELIVDGYDIQTIKKKLGLNDNRFKMIIQRMRSEDKVEPLNKLRGVR